jgi:hypothetical protein
MVAGGKFEMGRFIGFKNWFHFSVDNSAPGVLNYFSLCVLEYFAGAFRLVKAFLESLENSWEMRFTGQAVHPKMYPGFFNRGLPERS